MKLEQHVVSLKLAKGLKEAGYPQERSNFYWHLDGNDEWELVRVEDVGQQVVYFMYAAPLASELGENLPWRITPKAESAGRLTIEKGIDWTVGYISYEGIKKGGRLNQHDDLLVNAAAKMWLYLKKEGLL